MRNLFLCVAMLVSFAAQAEECADFSGKWMFQGCEDQHKPEFIRSSKPLVIKQWGCDKIKIEELEHIGSVKTVSSSGSKDYTVSHIEWSEDRKEINQISSIYSYSEEKSSYLSIHEGKYFINGQGKFVTSFRTKTIFYKNLVSDREGYVKSDCYFDRI